MTVNKAKPVTLEVFIDEARQKVLFAEAEKDFVDILFSFLTLPMGTILKHLSKHSDSRNVKLGSLSSLYGCVENLETEHFGRQLYKEVLLSPKNSSKALCQMLKVNLDDLESTEASDGGSNGNEVFVKSKASFIITDDLNVMPNLIDSCITLLNNLGIQYMHMLDKRTVYLGLEEFLNMLKWSLVTNNPLTNLVFGESEPSLGIAKSASSTSSYPDEATGVISRTIKLLVQKSTNVILCAEVQQFFVEILCSFLTIPLGAVEKLTQGCSPISNLYNSISSLDTVTYLKSDDVKTMLLSPIVAPNYYCVTDLLPVYVTRRQEGRFMKEQPKFMVFDNLVIELSSSISIISKFSRLGIPAGDMEVREVSIGKEQALSILKASLTSTSPLTDVFSTLTKKPSEEEVPEY